MIIIIIIIIMDRRDPPGGEQRCFPSSPALPYLSGNVCEVSPSSRLGCASASAAAAAAAAEAAASSSSSCHSRNSPPAASLRWAGGWRANYSRHDSHRTLIARLEHVHLACLFCTSTVCFDSTLRARHLTVHQTGVEVADLAYSQTQARGAAAEATTPISSLKIKKPAALTRPLPSPQPHSPASFPAGPRTAPARRVVMAAVIWQW